MRIRKDKPLNIIRSYMCLPNTLGHRILQVMNWDTDVMFLVLKLKFTVYHSDNDTCPLTHVVLTCFF